MTGHRSFQIRAILIVISASVAALSADADPPKTDDEASAVKMLQEFSKPIPGVNWDQMSPQFVTMIDRIFERNDWTDESDQYARRVASRVAAIPPWDLAGRFGALTEEVSDRYDLTPQQAAMFQRAVMRESAVLLLKHGAELWEQGKQALQDRAEGKPYTAEQISRWAQVSEPIFDEMEKGIERVAGELEQSLPEEQKSVLQKDMAGFHKRQKVVEEMNRRWAKGLWKPEEWGMEDDPIQIRGARAAAADAPPPVAIPIPRAPRPSAPLVAPEVVAVTIPDHWVAHDPTTWIALVVEVGKKYRLDAGQMDTARSIHEELVDRADRYSSLRETELAAVPTAQRATHPAYRPICELFEELRERLESLPTSAQRVENDK